MPLLSKIFVSFFQQFHSLSLQSVGHNLGHDLAEIADKAVGMIVLTLPEVAFLWYRCDERLCPLLRPFFRLPDFLTYLSGLLLFLASIHK